MPGSTGSGSWGPEYTQTTMSYVRDRSALVMDALCAARDKECKRERERGRYRQAARDRRAAGQSRHSL